MTDDTSYFPYQLTGAEWLASKKTGLLADEMGLGKTAQAILAVVAVRALRVAVVCRSFLRANWQREIEMRDPAYGFRDWQIFSHHDLRKKPPQSFDVLIVDEAHDFKSRDSARTKALYGKHMLRNDGWASKAERVWLLTGTPTPNNPLELWTHLRALAPDVIDNGKGPLDHDSFQRRYTTGFQLPMIPPRWKITGGKNIDELRSRIAPFVLRRRKADVLKDLPPIRYGELVLVADDAGVRAKVAGEENTNKAALEQVLRINFGKRPLKPDEQDALSELRKLHALAKAEPLAEILLAEMREGLTKVVVMGWHVDALKAFAGAIKAAGVGVAMVTGEVPMAERDGLVTDFQTSPITRVFVGQIAAAGVGLTLTAASDLVFLEMSWSPEDNRQAAMRVHRIGQSEPVLVRYATLAGSIDGAVQRTLRQKMNMIRELT